MAALTFGIRVAESRGNGASFHEITHPVLYLRAGRYAGERVTYHNPGGGQPQGYDNQRAAWKPLSLAIQTARALSFAMPSDPDVERMYRKHTTLAERLSHVSLLAYEDGKPPPPSFVARPAARRIDLFDVTVAASMPRHASVTYVSLYYSGATREWF